MSSEDNYLRQSRVVCKKGLVDVSFQVRLYMQKEWVVGGGRLCGHLWKQGLPGGVPKYLERFNL